MILLGYAVHSEGLYIRLLTWRFIILGKYISQLVHANYKWMITLLGPFLSPRVSTYLRFVG